MGLIPVSEKALKGSGRIEDIMRILLMESREARGRIEEMNTSPGVNRDSGNSLFIGILQIMVYLVLPSLWAFIMRFPKNRKEAILIGTSVANS